MLVLAGGLDWASRKMVVMTKISRIGISFIGRCSKQHPGAACRASTFGRFGRDQRRRSFPRPMRGRGYPASYLISVLSIFPDPPFARTQRAGYLFFLKPRVSSPLPSVLSVSLWLTLLSSLAIEVERELPGRGPHADGVDFGPHLVFDPGVNHVRGEDVALEQKFVIFFQAAQRLFQAARGLGHVPEFLRVQAVDVLVQGRPGRKLLLDPVQPSHEQGGKGKVAVAGGVGEADLRPLIRGTRAVHGDPDRGGAVAGGGGQVDGRLEA